MSSINPGTINNAANGDKEAMRIVLNAIMAQLGIPGSPALLEPTSGATPQKPVNAVPPQATLAVTGANGSYSGAITPAPQTVAPTVWYEVSYSTTSNFGNPTALPLSTATSFASFQPGTTLFWRIRSSYDQAHFNAYRPALGNAAVAAGLQSSAATANAVALNITNYALVDAVPDGLGAQNVRVYGAAGPQTMWPGVKGAAETIFPSATIINSTLGSKPFVAFDGEQFVVRNTLPQVFADDLTPVGQVGTPEGGSITEPTVTATVSGGGIIGYVVTGQGANLTADVTLTITDATGSGAIPGPQTIVGGKLIAVAPGVPGTLYTAPTVAVSGGRAAAAPGGGTITGNNGGRLTALSGNP